MVKLVFLHGSHIFARAFSKFANTVQSSFQGAEHKRFACNILAAVLFLFIATLRGAAGLAKCPSVETTRTLGRPGGGFRGRRP